MKSEKNLFESKIKKIDRNLTELEENLSKTKKYYNYDDTEYKGIRNIRDVFDLSIDKNYYKPILTRGAFKGVLFKLHTTEKKLKKHK